MKKLRTIWVCTALFLFMSTGSANATYIGSFRGNDNDKWNSVDWFLHGSGYKDIYGGTLELLGKSDQGVAITLNDDGTWALNPENDFTSEDVGFISVKSGRNRTYVFRANDFNYLLDEKGKQIFYHDVSHISFWKAKGYGGPSGGGGGGAQVPEPTTVFLLGSGLLGLFGLRKKFWKAKTAGS